MPTTCSQVFNVGEFRRRLGLSGVDKSFFEANNAEAQKTREHMAAQVLDEAYEWLSAAADDVSMEEEEAPLTWRPTCVFLCGSAHHRLISIPT